MTFSPVNWSSRFAAAIMTPQPLVLALVCCLAFRTARTEYTAEFDSHAVYADNATDVNRACAELCTVLESTFASTVALRNTTAFKANQNSYWSQFQAEVSPQCFIQPATAEEVAAIVVEAATRDCPFAVRSGGHAAYVGGSNIPDGLTIDLTLLNELTVSEDRETTRIGPGNMWINVYQKLTPMGLSVVGGRVANIGVGGLTLGGGISWYVGRRGWACDGVRNYELVTADGEILQVNLASYPDLYWALRGGGNNFGIVTRFDLETFEQGPMWGGAVFNSIEHNATLLDALVDFTSKASEDIDAFTWVALVYVQPQESWFASTEMVSAKPEPNPAIFKDLAAVAALQSSLRATDIADLALEMKESNPNGLRQNWWTLTFKNNAEILKIAHKIHAEEVEAIKDVAGLVAPMVAQPITLDVIRLFSKNGGNPLGMKEEDGPLQLLNIASMWADSSRDEEVMAAHSRMIDRMVAAAKELGVYHPYIYQNYAANEQDVFAGYGEENRARLREISRKFDPEQVFQRLQPGYFKL
ncbi:hypothetical protein LTR62_006470 [Meristemomyces frigidus]|uniref:FAD-binding PCMH-type domain-containing protein n=1 Tax=Meristemomyces frigidus TaxID=1508187 RepID=A0AAN7TC95_9PEZI|nr:hypothetical protein LTR62_006470 [Meristemomyces frigidus]